MYARMEEGTAVSPGEEGDAQRFFEAASEPKEIRWYDAGHFLNEQARQDRMAWLGERLGLCST